MVVFCWVNLLQVCRDGLKSLVGILMRPWSKQILAFYPPGFKTLPHKSFNESTTFTSFNVLSDYSPVINLAPWFWILSIFLMFSFVCGSQIGATYSTICQTSFKVNFSDILRTFPKIATQEVACVYGLLRHCINMLIPRQLWGDVDTKVFTSIGLPASAWPWRW